MSKNCNDYGDQLLYKSSLALGHSHNTIPSSFLFSLSRLFSLAKKMAKTLAMLLLLLQLTSFIAFAEELESLHTPTPLHPSAKAPRRRHNNPSPTPSRSHVHAPLHPPHHAKPPTHHNHQRPLTHAPIQPPTHHHPPAHAPVHKHIPVHPPFHAHVPTKSPSPDHHPHHHNTPALAPAHTPLRSIFHSRSLIAVQGVVYVKSCKHAGGDTLLGASSLIG